MVAITEAVTLERDGEIGLLWIDNPPVNALGQAVRQGLAEGVVMLEKGEDLKAMVIICRGRTFCAGADIRELGKKMLEPFLPEVLHSFDRCTKPIIAAIHGTALGGGFETALSCHYRIAVPTARLGLPEVKLGLLPAAGGTQRLPRLIGVEKALNMILSGDPIDAAAALEKGVIDELAEGDLATAAVAFARRVLAENRPLVQVSAMTEKIGAAHAKPEIFDEYRKRVAQEARGYDAPQSCIKAVEGAVKLPFLEGCANERKLFYQLREGTQSAAQRYYFFAERTAAKIPDIPKGTPALDIAKVGIVGADSCGIDLAVVFIKAGFAVTLVDPQSSDLDLTLRNIRERTGADGGEKGINNRKGQRPVSVTAATNLEALADADLILVSAHDDPELKKGLIATLDEIRSPKAILAVNSAFPDLGAISSASEHPQTIIGLHFLEPLDTVRLVEIARAEKTSVEVLSTILSLIKKIKKVGVVVAAKSGLAANRMFTASAQEAVKLLLEGALPAQVDRVLYDFGFPLGLFAQFDLTDEDRSAKAAVFGADFIEAVLYRHERFGISSGMGFYNYTKNSRIPKPAPEVDRQLEAYAEKNGFERREISDEEILKRCIYAVINTGAELLDEAIVLRPSDLDVIWVNAFGWPVYWGGPMFYADHMGPSKVVEDMVRFQTAPGNDMKPASLLAKLAEEGKTFNSLNS